MMLRKMMALMSKKVSHTYATWNSSDGDATLSNGNLTSSHTQNQYRRATIGKSSGKWYWEVHLDSTSGSPFYQVGIATLASNISATIGGVDALSYGYNSVNGQMRNNAADNAYGATSTTGQTLGVALDLTSNQLTIYINNSSQGAYSISAGTYYPAVSDVSAATIVMTANFGATAMTYSPPSGFNAGLYN